MPSLHLPHGTALCLHPSLGLARAWTRQDGDQGSVVLAWPGGETSLDLPGLRAVSLEAWGDRLLLALKSVRSDIDERVLVFDPQAAATEAGPHAGWRGVASLQSFGAVAWARPAGAAVIIRGQALYRVGADGGFEALGDAGEAGVSVEGGRRVATTAWSADAGRRRVVLVGEEGGPELLDAPAPDRASLFALDDGVAWRAEEGLIHWSPLEGVRCLHPDPGPFVAGVWRSGGRLVWTTPEHTRGPGQLVAADGGRRSLSGGAVPVAPVPGDEGRWFLRRPVVHVAQSAAVSSAVSPAPSEGAGLGALLRAVVQGDELVEEAFVVPVGDEAPPVPTPVAGPAPLRKRSVRCLEVHPAVLDACEALGLDTLGALDGASRAALVTAVADRGLAHHRAARAVGDLASILADMGLALR